MKLSPGISVFRLAICLSMICVSHVSFAQQPLITLTTSSNPSIAGAAITLTSTTACGPKDGQISFYYGTSSGSIYNLITTDSGVVARGSTTWTPPSAGTYYLQATALNFPFSTCDGTSNIITLVVNPAGVQGYIDPKYIVVGVTYAPPGLNSSVTYTDSKSVATTNSISNSFSTSTTYTVSLGNSIGIGGWKVGTLVSNSNTASQSTKNTTSVTLSWSVANTVQTFGTPTSIVSGAYISPVDNDYDIIYVWLNPVEVLTVAGSSVTWNGYGYDANDQNGLDIVGIPLGYLNGDLGPMPQEYLNSTNRTWATGQIFATGQSAALTAADFAEIATFDPFSNSSYGTDEIGFNPPATNTPDGRFTLTTCNSGNSVPFDQAAPSQTPGIYTCTLNYSNLSTTSLAVTTSSSNTFSIDRSYSGSVFGNNLTLDFKYANTVTSTTEVDNSIATTQASSATASITGLACNNSVADIGPCVPPYDGPTEFDIYSDNLWGTFMFAPVHYY